MVQTQVVRNLATLLFKQEFAQIFGKCYEYNVLVNGTF